MELEIVDNFLIDPDEVRDTVLRDGDFRAQEYEGHTYSGIYTGTPLSVVEDIEDIHGRDIKPVMAFWRISYPGDDTPAPIHADSICARWAGLLYMTPTREVGGTAFWRHKESRDTEFPAVKRATRDQDYVDMINRDAADESAWDMTVLVRSKYNRFITYPTHYYHSRYPFYSENYGNTLETARLIWVVFYN